MGSFKKDFEVAKKAVEVVRKLFEAKDCKVRELGREEQIFGDLEIIGADKSSFHEVKFDMMAEKTGNLCFETHNGKGLPTGISTTKADVIDYVVPTNGGMRIFSFESAKLKDYLFGGKAHKVVNGGDGRKYSMILVPITQIESDSVGVVTHA
jgi:hypothetical protein